MLARSGTMALRQQQQLLEGSLASAYRGDSKETQPPQPQQTGMAGLGADQSRTNEEWDADWGAADGPNEGRAASMRRHTATPSADETRQSVRRRKQLERHVEALKRRLLEQEQRVASLEEEQRQAIEGRREQLRETARRMRDGDSSDSPEVRPTAPRSWGITRAATRLITTQSPAKRLEALRRKQASEVCQARASAVLHDLCEALAPLLQPTSSCVLPSSHLHSTRSRHLLIVPHYVVSLRARSRRLLAARRPRQSSRADLSDLRSRADARADAPRLLHVYEEDVTGEQRQYLISLSTVCALRFVIMVRRPKR